MSKLLGKEVLSLTRFVSKEDSRYALTKIRVHKDFAEATDGKVIMRVPLSSETGDFPKNTVQNLNGDDVLISAKTLEKVFANVPKKPAVPVLGYVLLGKENGNFQLVANDLDSEHKISFRKDEAEYPDTDKVMPKNVNGLKISISGNYLKRVAEYACKHGVDGDVINFTFTNPQDPICFDIPVEGYNGKTVNAYGVMMPVVSDYKYNSKARDKEKMFTRIIRKLASQCLGKSKVRRLKGRV